MSDSYMIVMKKISLILLGLVFLLSTTVFAGSTVTFSWEPNSESDLAGYKLYQSDTSGNYVIGVDKPIADIEAGTEIVTITDISDGHKYWILTAYDFHKNESGPSNEVSKLLDSTPPKAPVLKVIVIVEIK